jgi:hypothetical protein
VTNDQREREEVLRNDQRVRNDNASTLHRFAESESGNIRGRFAAHEKSTIVGAAPTPQYPRLPETSFSNQGTVVPQEESLGFSIDEAPIVGEAFEVAKSLGDAVFPSAVAQGDVTTETDHRDLDEFQSVASPASEHPQPSPRQRWRRS